MHIALFEIAVGVATLTWIVTLLRSLYVILTTRQPTWNAAGMSQTLWLAVVILMPLIGTVLFAAAGYRRLPQYRLSGPPEATSQ